MRASIFTALLLAALAIASRAQIEEAGDAEEDGSIEAEAEEEVAAQPQGGGGPGGRPPMSAEQQEVRTARRHCARGYV